MSEEFFQKNMQDNIFDISQIKTLQTILIELKDQNEFLTFNNAKQYVNNKLNEAAGQNLSQEKANIQKILSCMILEYFINKKNLELLYKGFNATLKEYIHLEVIPRSQSILEENSFTKRNSILDTTRSGVYRKEDQYIEPTNLKNILIFYKAGAQIIKRIVLLQIAKVFFNLKAYQISRIIENKHQRIVLRNFAQRQKFKEKQTMKIYFEKWHNYCLSTPYRSKDISNNFKGRLLLSLTKNRSNLNQRAAFFKWKVRSNPKYLKAVLIKFVLYPKINKYTSFWRLTTVLEPKENRLIQNFRFRKLQRSLLTFRAVIMKYQRKNINMSFYNIYKFSNLMLKRSQSLRIFDRLTQKPLFEIFERWKQLDHNLRIFEQKKIFLKALLKSSNLLQLAFCQWKECVYKQKMLQQSRFVSFLQRFPDLLSSYIRKTLKYSLDKLIQESKRSERKKKVIKLFVEHQRLKWERAFYEWKKFANHLKTQELIVINHFDRVISIISKSKIEALKHSLTSIKIYVAYRNLIKKHILKSMLLMARNKAKIALEIWKNEIKFTVNRAHHDHTQKICHNLERILKDNTAPLFTNFKFAVFATSQQVILKKLQRKIDEKLKDRSLFWKSRTFLKKQALLYKATNKLFSVLNEGLRTNFALLNFGQIRSPEIAIKIVNFYFKQRMRIVLMRWKFLVQAKTKGIKYRTHPDRSYSAQSTDIQAIYKLLRIFYNLKDRPLKLTFNTLQTFSRLKKQKLSVLIRMNQAIKIKQAFVFEVWKGLCTQKLLKCFYDVILLEKSLINYANCLKTHAFHKICTAGLLEYWRTFNSALWKWKLANVEARYYSKQKVVLSKSNAICTMVTLLDRHVRDTLQKSFFELRTKN